MAGRFEQASPRSKRGLPSANPSALKSPKSHLYAAHVLRTFSHRLVGRH